MGELSAIERKIFGWSLFCYIIGMIGLIIGGAMADRSFWIGFLYLVAETNLLYFSALCYHCMDEWICNIAYAALRFCTGVFLMVFLGYIVVSLHQTVPHKGSDNGQTGSFVVILFSTILYFGGLGGLFFIKKEYYGDKA